MHARACSMLHTMTIVCCMLYAACCIYTDTVQSSLYTILTLTILYYTVYTELLASLESHEQLDYTRLVPGQDLVNLCYVMSCPSFGYGMNLNPWKHLRELRT